MHSALLAAAYNPEASSLLITSIPVLYGTPPNICPNRATVILLGRPKAFPTQISSITVGLIFVEDTNSAKSCCKS